MKKGILTKSPQETRALAIRILRGLVKTKNPRRASIIAFSGELGAGKTTLVQALGRVMGVTAKIQSPTFVTMRRYRIQKKNSLWKNLIHIDAYRLNRPHEAVLLGLGDIFTNQKNIVAIEWADRIKKFLPKETVWVELRHRGGNHRHIIIKK